MNSSGAKIKMLLTAANTLQEAHFGGRRWRSKLYSTTMPERLASSSVGSFDCQGVVTLVGFRLKVPVASTSKPNAKFVPKVPYLSHPIKSRMA